MTAGRMSTGSGRDLIEVATRSGPILGSENRGVHVFRGVPYAAPPVGRLRFRAPAPPVLWSRPRFAVEPGPAAPQVLGYSPSEIGNDVMSEDCLTLNIWTPCADSGSRPVMVWIHGGANVEGSARNPWYDGTSLALRGDVVVVTIQYRLGVFGFLELTDIGGGRFAGSGNAGLLDQIAALEWVRDNIASFGGDPGNVTAFGESAGGGDIYHLLGAPAAQGLFHKAVIQSGICFPLASRQSATQGARDFMDQICVQTAEELQEVSWTRLLTLADEWFWGRPHIDDHVLFEQTDESIVAGTGGNVPLIIGTTLDEIRYWTALCAVPGDDSVTPAVVYRSVFGSPASLEPYFGDRVQGVIEAYTEVYTTRYDAVVTFLGDANFRIPSIWCAEDVGGRQPVWMYIFTYRSPEKGRTGMDYGACHAMELPFVFGVDDASALAVTGPNDLHGDLASTIMDAWTAFARVGDPSTPSLPWPGYDTSRRVTMELGLTCRAVEDPHAVARRLWRAVPRAIMPYRLPFAV